MAMTDEKQQLDDATVPLAAGLRRTTLSSSSQLKDDTAAVSSLLDSLEEPNRQRRVTNDFDDYNEDDDDGDDGDDADGDDNDDGDNKAGMRSSYRISNMTATMAMKPSDSLLGAGAPLRASRHGAELTAQEEAKSWQHLDSVHSRASAFGGGFGDNDDSTGDEDDDDFDESSSFASFGASDSSLHDGSDSNTDNDHFPLRESKRGGAVDPLASAKADFQKLADDLPKTMTPSRRLMLNRAQSVRVRPLQNFRGSNLGSLMEDRASEW